MLLWIPLHSGPHPFAIEAALPVNTESPGRDLIAKCQPLKPGG